ncbi:unnamed protein product [Danaus chrysippus]|uniref:(African queen) hypothetical protein n=1 Tax=Danaus chrysippus TaxID=151541 RepID=A0A8J2MEN4_9NEOP|nr:unnamed protein product [Danaus chrysippus]
MYLFLPCIACTTCEEVLDLPEKSKLNLNDLKAMKPNETVKCLTHLTRHKLSPAEAKFIWIKIVDLYNGTQNIPDDVLKELHWVITVVTPEEFSNLTLSNIEVISTLGVDYGLSQAQLDAIADRVREDFGGKQPEDYTSYDLIGLRQILCAFNASEIDRIHPKAYKEAASVIGNLKNCDYEVLKAFAALAIQKSAFGPPRFWTNGTLQILGAVANFFPKEFVNSIKSSNNGTKS